MSEPLSSRSRAFWFPDGKHRLPNMTYGRRLVRQRIAWNLGWWLIRRVCLGWMTPEGQARQITQALGWYRPDPSELPLSGGAVCGTRSSGMGDNDDRDGGNDLHMAREQAMTLPTQSSLSVPPGSGMIAAQRNRPRDGCTSGATAAGGWS